MTAPIVTRTAQDMATEIKRLFGDESGVQIVDSDIIRWINFGQVEICSKTRILKAIQIGNLTIGTSVYQTPTNYLEMEAVWIDGIMLQATSWEEFRQASYNKAESGTPLSWFLYANQINLYPVPDAAKEIKIYYAAQPNDINSLGELLSIPDRYFDRLKEYCMTKAYELDEDWTAHQVQRDQMESNLREIANADSNVQGPYLIARDSEDEYGGNPKTLGPFKGGLNNAAGLGEYIDDDELFKLDNLEVDVDGSLANRPSIRMLSLASLGAYHSQVVGVYKSVDGNTYLALVANGTVYMYNSKTGANASGSGAPMIATCGIQWMDKMYIVSSDTSKVGGFFSYAAGVFTWTAVPTMPTGESITIYRNRLFIASGIGAITNSSRMYYSAVDNGASWPVSSNVDIDAGNGEKLTCIIGMANDILCFKEHSTYRYGFQTDSAQAELSKISGTIGTPNYACAATYDNNNVYLLHGDATFELFNYTFTEISQKVKFQQRLDPLLLASETFGLTVFRNRLFVRFYADMYVYNIKTQSWSSWTSTRKFSRLYIIPSADIGLDFAFAHPATSTDNGKIYYFQDDRITGVGGSGNTGESFDCSLVTKTYDFDVPYQFKVQYYWATDIATSGVSEFSSTLPNAQLNNTWDYQKANYTWDSAKAQLTWDTGGSLVINHVEGAGLGAYRRKYIKLEKKIRFRQVYFSLTSAAVANTVGDSSVRIYDMVSFLDTKEHVSKRIS